MVSKMEPAFYEPDFVSLVRIDVLVKPPGICSRMQQHYHAFAVACMGFIVSLPDPFGYIPAVGRITKYHLIRPILAETVLLNSEIPLAFMILIVGTGIKCEVELLIELIEEILRSSPVLLLILRILRR